jgi:hypothetical protein
MPVTRTFAHKTSITDNRSIICEVLNDEENPANTQWNTICTIQISDNRYAILPIAQGVIRELIRTDTARIQARNAYARSVLEGLCEEKP